MNKISIRRATACDLPGLRDMVHLLAHHHGDAATVTRRDLERDLTGADALGAALVADTKNGLAGYAVVFPLMQLIYGARGMDMHHLYVRPAFRQQGVGRALLEACLNEARRSGAQFFVVGTHPDNHAAQGFYRAAGLEPRPTPGPRFSMRL